MAAASILRSRARACLPSPRLCYSSFQPSRVEAHRAFSSYLVTPQELHEALKKNAPSKISTLPRTIPLCASWFLPNDGRNGLDSFREKRIQNARFFDIDKNSDTRSPYPHMLPSPQDFASAMSGLGIRKDDTVVVYDTAELGIFSAPRVSWTLKVFGHNHVHILNNFKLWVEEGYPTETGEFYTVDTCTYQIPTLDDGKVADFAEVREVARDHKKEGSEGVQILDARPPGRWSGTEPEPRPEISSGHMPGSINIPMSELLDFTSKTFLPPDELRKVFEAKGVDPSRPIINSCGSGVTAAIVDAALTEAGYGSESTRKIYDGSWTEFAQRVKPSDRLILKPHK